MGLVDTKVGRHLQLPWRASSRSGRSPTGTVARGTALGRNIGETGSVSYGPSNGARPWMLASAADVG